MRLYNSGQITKTCRQILPEMADDLEQEIMLTLFEKPEAKIIAASNGGYFPFYVVRIIINLARGKNAAMHKKFNHLNKCEHVPMPINLTNYEKDTEGEVRTDERRYELARQVELLIDSEHYDTTIDEKARHAAKVMDTWSQPGEYPYDKNLFLLHLSIGNKKELSRRTGIPYRSVCYTIDNCKQRLRDALSDY